MNEIASNLPSAARLDEVMQAGNKAMQEGLWKDAARYFETAIDLKPQYVEAWIGMAASLRNSDDLYGALEAYRKSLTINPRNPDAWTGLIDVLHDLEMYEEEVEACESLLRVSPRSDEALLNKGVALHTLGKIEAALECFDQLIERRPENVAALNNRGAILLAIGRLEEALDAFDRALALEPQHEDVLRNRCLLLLRLGRYSEAVRAAEEMLALREEGWLWMLKGLAHAELREVPLALQSLERAKYLDPILEGLDEAIKRMRKLRDAMEGKEGKEEEREETEETVSEEAEPLPVAPQGLAIILNQIGFPTESLRIWQESLDKNSADDWIGLSKALFAGGERDAARRCMQEAVKRGGFVSDGLASEFALDVKDIPPGEIDVGKIPQSEMPFLWREAARLAADNRFPDASRVLHQALGYDNNLERGWNWLGILEALSGNLGDAETALRKAADTEVGYPIAWNNLGAVLASSGKLNEAATALKEAMQIDPKHAEAMHNLGVVESRLDHDDEAAKLLRQALKIEARPQTWFVLANVMEKKNRWREAVSCYEKAMKLGRKNKLAASGLARARAELGSRRRNLVEKSIQRLVKMEGIGPERARNLAKSGYSSPSAIRKAGVEELARLPGFNRAVASQLKRDAGRQLRRKRKPGSPEPR